MEIKTQENIDEIPMVARNNKPDIDDVIAAIIKADLHDSDGIMQSCEHHTTMLHVQRKIKSYMDGNYSIDKDKLLSMILRCEEVLYHLNLIRDASHQNRYVKLSDATRE